MPTPPGSGSSDERPPLEPVRVMRLRRTDALAELIRDMQDGRDFESVPLPDTPAEPDDDTEELPPVPGALPRVRSAGQHRQGIGRGQRLAAAVIAVAAAAVIGFGCALLLPGRTDAAAAPPRTSAPEAPAPTPTPTPTPTESEDPDGAGTLREGDSGPEVTDLQRRLLKIPNVYENGSTAGTYDTTLTEAVARFQLWYGIRGDENGVYGDDTRQSLESRTQ